ncbi:hypothetical protein KBB08_02435 [Candidatus Gracilibacteria bacterium]|nr:hypothetical protein [Candidatus Gracilibacteria bacterium]
MGRSRATPQEQGLLFRPEQLIPVPVSRTRTLIAAALAAKQELLPLLENQAPRVRPVRPQPRPGSPRLYLVVATEPEPDNTLVNLRQQISALQAHSSNLTPETRPLVAEYIAGKIMDLAKQNLDAQGVAKAFPFTLSAIEQVFTAGPETMVRQAAIAALNTVEKAIMEEMATFGEYDLVKDIPDGSGLANVFDSLSRLERICADCYKQQQLVTKTK